jgi:hypothetical protein
MIGGMGCDNCPEEKPEKKIKLCDTVYLEGRSGCDKYEKLKKQNDIMREALDKYTSNPEHWEKSKDEWYAVYAKEALEKCEAISNDQR